MRTIFYSCLLACTLAINTVGADETDFRLRSHHLAGGQATESDVAAEIAFGQSIAARVLGRVPLYTNPQVTRYVNLVGRAVAMHASRPELSYRFAILDSDEVNAYSAPGGYIFLTRGALQTLQDEAELAAVLAHEIAHITQRHIVKQFNIRGSDESATSSVGRLLGGSSDSARIAISQAVDKAVSMLFETGYNHRDELESDQVASVILAMTGYDPSALHRYLNRLNKANSGRKKVSRTHPPTTERLNELMKTMKAEGLDKLQYPRATNRFKVNAKLP